MKNKIKIKLKRLKNKKGFTLTEVLIGMLILTVSIVTATSILVGVIQTNRNIVKIEQAYYLAVEGLEAFRNIRDTNWLNNVDFRGRNDFLGRIEIGQEYVVGIKSQAWKNSVKEINPPDLTRFLTWDFSLRLGENDSLCLINEDGRSFYGLCSGIIGKKSEFSRYIKIEPFCDERGKALCENSFKATSIVYYFDRGVEKTVEISAVFTNWKKS